MFGGAQISTDAALFDLEVYGGNIVSDLFSEDRYFDDAEHFWATQNIAIAEAKEAYLADGWSEVIVLDMGEYFPSYDYVDTAKEDGGKVYIAMSHNGEVTAYEGQLSRKDIKARDKAKTGEPAQPSKPEITKAMQNYLGLHRHASVRSDVLGNSDIALRLIAAHLLAGSDLWMVRAEPQRADKDIITESLAVNPTQMRFDAEREAIAALLDCEDTQDIVSIFAKLSAMSDEDVTRILTFLMAETLQAHTPLVEYLGQQMETDPMTDWSPDEVFVDLLRDKQVINAMVGEVAGDAAAKGNITATAKVQKGILKDCISGARECDINDWRPRYMSFPMSAYTDWGGIAAIEAAKDLPTETAEPDMAEAA